MTPGGLRPTSAKDLMLKDADYSTPTDHYFSYLGKVKSGELSKSEQEDRVLSTLDIDTAKFNQVVAQVQQREPTLTELFQSLPHDKKVALAKKRGFGENDFDKIIKLLETDDNAT